MDAIALSQLYGEEITAKLAKEINLSVLEEQSILQLALALAQEVLLEPIAPLADGLAITEEMSLPTVTTALAATTTASTEILTIIALVFAILIGDSMLMENAPLVTLPAPALPSAEEEELSELTA